MFNKITIPVLAALALAATLALTSVHVDASSTGDNNHGAIVVQVTDIHGKRIEGARVVLTSHSTGANTDMQLTGEDGTTLFSDLRPGPYTVVAAHEDVGKGNRRARVIRRHKTRASVVLRR